ncbi:MAG: hypothetical protein M0R39_15135 [Prolixibacteraceae bacterium]|nr:hypothetical protein [Prolixibacteraceae bacterium]
MKFYKLLLFASIALGMQACMQKQAKKDAENPVKYYRGIQFSETPFDTERGTHELTAKEAATINNYKFTFNGNKQLASVEYNRNNALLDYSSMGAAKVTYTYEGDKQVKRFFNAKNEPIKNGGASVFEYKLDVSGMRVAMRYLDENSAPVENRNKIHNYQWTKLPDGMIKELRFNLAGASVVMNEFCPFYELRFSYDKDGYITRMANYQADTLYNCTAENCGDIGVSYFKFANNNSGDLLSFEVHNKIGQLSNLYWGWAKRVNAVDANGYVTETSMFDQDNEYLGGKNVPVTRTEYDAHGAVVKRISMDKEKKIMNNPANGVAIIAYKYDDHGTRTETLQYDKENVLIPPKK